MKQRSKHPFSSPRGLALLATCAALTAFVPVAQADEALPTAREVLDRFVEVTGAAKLVERSDGIQTTGTFSVPAQGMEGKMVIHAKAPNLLLVRIEIPGFGEIFQGYDGNVGWTMDPASGPALAEEEALAQLKDQSNFFSSLYRDEDLQSLEFVGKEEFAGNDAYRVAVVNRNGSESTLFFSVESGLLVGIDSVQHTPMGEIAVRATIGEYQEFDGVMMPTRTEQTMMGMQQVMVIESLSFEAIADSVFALPEAVAGLVPAH